MKLSSELLAHIAHSLENSPSDHVVAEHRGEARTPLLGQATIIPCPARCGRRPASVAVSDLSPLGIGVIHDQRLDSGEQFILRVPGDRRSSPTAFLCIVMHCRPIGPGAFALGARFAGRIEQGNAATSERPDPSSLDSMTHAFRQQAAAGLSQDEAEQLRAVESRLSKLTMQ